MSAPITLVQYPGLSGRTTVSPPCAKVHMALHFKGLDYEIKNISTPMEAKRYNERGRVPVLLIGDERFVDSTDILSELERRFPEPPLDPTEPAARATSKILEDWADEVLYFYGLYLRFCVPDGFERMKQQIISRIPAPARWIAPFIARRVSRKRANSQGVGLKGEEVARREIVECYRAIADLLGKKPFLVTDCVTRGDLALAATLDQHRIVSLTPGLAREIEDIPALVAWLDRVHEKAPNVAEPR